MVYDQSMRSENKRLREEAKIAILMASVKLFFKFCEDKKPEAVQAQLIKLRSILEWYGTEMGESLETYELLNFYYGVLKELEGTGFESAVKILNSSFVEELLPVHPQVPLPAQKRECRHSHG